MPPYIEWSAVFLGMVVVDYFYAEYTKAAASRQIQKASIMATALIFVTGFVTSSYVSNQWLIIPASFGAYVGTYLSLRFGK